MDGWISEGEIYLYVQREGREDGGKERIRGAGGGGTQIGGKIRNTRIQNH